VLTPAEDDAETERLIVPAGLLRNEPSSAATRPPRLPVRLVGRDLSATRAGPLGCVAELSIHLRARL